MFAFVAFTGILVGLIGSNVDKAVADTLNSTRQGFYSQFPSQPEPFITKTDQWVRQKFLSGILPLHTVRPGETLYSLSRYYFVSLDSLKELNQIDNPANLEVGKELFIPPVDYRSATLQHYHLKSGETVYRIITRYNLQKYQFQRLNPNLNLRNVPNGSDVIIPAQPIQQGLTQYPGIRLISPVIGLLTSRFGMRWGRMHYGLDLAAPMGTPVKSAAVGKVEFSGWESGYGLLIKINHGQYSTMYGHLSKSFVMPGMRVAQGQLIGLVGATGHAYGSHLHFEVEKAGQKINPYQYLYHE